jgi:putative hydrolase of the HAD superfamily
VLACRKCDPSRTHNGAPKALLFDLGGVLLEIDFAAALRSWAAYSELPFEELTRRFRFDLAYERHERGEVSASEYFSHVAEKLRLSATREQIEIGWNSIFVGEIATTRLWVERARKQLPCYALTNTNASHMAKWSRLYPGVASAFDKLYASHEIGLRKPDREAFEFICRDTGLEPSAILFFDDLPDNVHAATAAGLQGVVVRSPKDVASSLMAMGISDSEG